MLGLILYRVESYGILWNTKFQNSITFIKEHRTPQKTIDKHRKTIEKQWKTEEHHRKQQNNHRTTQTDQEQLQKHRQIQKSIKHLSFLKRWVPYRSKVSSNFKFQAMIEPYTYSFLCGVRGPNRLRHTPLCRTVLSRGLESKLP